jgi:LETM1 and EF-hand domain-containing protein 1
MGTTALMRFRLRMKLEEIHADDLVRYCWTCHPQALPLHFLLELQEIEKEGMDMLSIPELQAACRERGMRAIGISKDGLRQRLQVQVLRD